MENLTEKENELRKLAEGGNYWDILNLADFLADNGKYEEAEEWYLKIAGENDTPGDANKNYSLMLLELERFDKAIKYVDIIVQNGADTIVMDIIVEKMDSVISNPDHPIWEKISKESFDMLMWDFQKSILELLNEDNIEKILLYRKESENEAISKSAEFYLFQMYFQGYCFFGYEVWTPGKQNFEKALKYAYVTLYDYEEYATELYSCSAIIEELDEEEKELFYKGVIDSLVEEKGYTIDDAFNAFIINCTSLSSIKLPDGLTKILEYAFSDCTSLSSIKLPDGLTKLSEYAFYNCRSLESIDLPNTVQCIEEGVFDSCENLKSITIPNSVTEMGGFVFSGCSSLETIYCEAEEKPDGWDDDWVGDECDAEVIWGYKK
jgi:hypothetical protein